MLDRSTYEIIAPIEDYQDISWVRKFFSFGQFEMTINFNEYNAQYVKKGNLIGVALDNSKEFDKVYMIEQVEFNQGDKAVDETIHVAGRDLGGMTEERLVLPKSNAAYQDFLGPFESLMKYFVTKSLLNADDVDRNIPNLVVKTDQGRGSDINYQVRYQRLSDALEEIGRQGQMGWEMSFNAEPLNEYIYFDIVLGNDKTDDVVLDFGFDSIIGQKLLKSDWGVKNYAYIGGTGSGINRQINQTHLGTNAPNGFDRRESWVDAQDQDNTTITDILTIKGKQFLLETDINDSVEVELNPFGQFVYRDDFDLGDTITVRNQRWEFQKAMQIVEIHVSISASSPRPQIKVVLDKPLPRIQEKLKRNFDLYKPSTRR